MRGLTLAERILSHAAGRRLRAGEVSTLEVDAVMVHDSITPSVIRILAEQLECERIHDPDRVVTVIDHVSPAANVATATAQAQIRAWVKEQGIRRFYDSGRGIAHQLLIEEHIAAPGRVIVGTDSHSTAYGAVASLGTGMGSTDVALLLASGRTWMKVPPTIRLRLEGRFRPGVSAKDLALHVARILRADGGSYAALEYRGAPWMTVGERTTLSTMAVEVGAKAGIVHPEGLPKSYEVQEWLIADDDAPVELQAEHLIDLASLVPQVALPSTVDNVRDLSDLERVPIDVVYLGTCTNGRHEDMKAAAAVLAGKQVAPGVRMTVVPASRDALQDAIADGTLAQLVAAGATIGPPGCGACIGRHMGVLAPGETCVFTGNRNFRGRMGSPEARIYLASPHVAATAALRGYLAAEETTPVLAGEAS